VAQFFTGKVIDVRFQNKNFVADIVFLRIHGALSIACGKRSPCPAPGACFQ
jgi:hypothetical protein